MQQKHTGLLDEIRSVAQERKAPACHTGKLIETFDDTTREELRLAMEDPTLPSTVIQTVLRRRGLFVGVDSLQRHRRGACGCA